MLSNIHHDQFSQSIERAFTHQERLQFTDRKGRHIPYVAIEGVKGVGKGTVLQCVRSLLCERGINAINLNPTQALPDHHYFEQLDRSLPLRQLDWWREHLYATRSEVHTIAVHEAICEEERSGVSVDLILGDRSIMTSVVTRCPPQPSLEELSESYKRVRVLERTIPLPDYIIWLDLAWTMLSERLRGRDRQYGLEDETRSRIFSTREAYCSLAHSSKDLEEGCPLSSVQWVLCDASPPPQITADKIVSMIEQHLKSYQRRNTHLEAV